MQFPDNLSYLLRNQLGEFLIVLCVIYSCMISSIWNFTAQHLPLLLMHTSGCLFMSQRPRYIELRSVMQQIPNISVEALDQYDHRLMDPNAQKVGHKKRKDQFKKLIAGTVGVMSYLASRGQHCSAVAHQKWPERHWPNNASHYSAVWFWLCCKSSVHCRKQMCSSSAGLYNQMKLILVGLGRICLTSFLSTESSVPAVQEGGSYPEPSIAL